MERAQAESGLTADAAFTPAQPVGIKITQQGPCIVFVPEFCTYSTTYHTEVPFDVASDMHVSQIVYTLRQLFPGRRESQIRYFDMAIDAPVGTFIPLTPALTRHQVMTFASTLPNSFHTIPSVTRQAIVTFFHRLYTDAPEAFEPEEVSTPAPQHRIASHRSAAGVKTLGSVPHWVCKNGS